MLGTCFFASAYPGGLFSQIRDRLVNWFATVKDDFVQTFITADRWKLFLSGLGVTMRITLFAALLGLVIGLLVAVMRLSRKKNGKKTFFSVIAGIYIDVIRGTPSVVQLLIMYNVVLLSIDNKVIIAIISFGINSGAYVAEIIRAGIQAVDKGQSEAGRSLGLSQRMTMQYIVIPQAIKNVLPALGNEFIVLLKETAIVGYIALMDLTKAGDFVMSRTYKAFMPLVGTAVIYFVIIKILSMLLSAFERRLQRSDSR